MKKNIILPALLFAFCVCVLTNGQSQPQQKYISTRILNEAIEPLCNQHSISDSRLPGKNIFVHQKNKILQSSYKSYSIVYLPEQVSKS